MKTRAFSKDQSFLVLSSVQAATCFSFQTFMAPTLKVIPKSHLAQKAQAKYQGFQWNHSLWTQKIWLPACPGAHNTKGTEHTRASSMPFMACPVHFAFKCMRHGDSKPLYGTSLQDLSSSLEICTNCWELSRGKKEKKSCFIVEFWTHRPFIHIYVNKIFFCFYKFIIKKIQTFVLVSSSPSYSFYCCEESLWPQQPL